MLTEDKQESLKDMLMQNLAECTNQIHKKVLDSSESKERSYDFLDLASFEIDDQMSSRIAERKASWAKKSNWLWKSLKAAIMEFAKNAERKSLIKGLWPGPWPPYALTAKENKRL